MALSWVLPDEGSATADQFFSSFSPQTLLWVPALWWYEVANVLAMAERKKRLRRADLAQAIELFARLPVRTDPLLGSDALRRFRSLAHEQTLSAYDASYLELAQRRGLGLATLDKPLAQAAHKTGVSLFGH